MEKWQLTTRGSVSLYVLVMVVATIAVLGAMLDVTGTIRSKQQRLEARRIVQTAFDGAVDYCVNYGSNTSFSFPLTVSLPLGSVSQTVVVTDNSSKIANTALVTGTLAYKGQTYTLTKVIGQGKLASSSNGTGTPTTLAALGQWGYAFYSTGGMNINATMRVGSMGTTSNAYFGGNVNANSSDNRFYCDLSIGGNVNGTIHVNGTYIKGAAYRAITSASLSNYSQNAYVVYSGGNVTVNGGTFPTPSGTSGTQTVTTYSNVNGTVTLGASSYSSVGTNYPIYYFNGDINLKGTFNGSGVIACSGTVFLTNSVTLASGAHLAIIAGNNVIIQGSGTEFDAYIYAGSTFTENGNGSTNHVYGAIVTPNQNLNAAFSLDYDPSLVNDSSLAQKLRLPGFWP